MKRSGALRPALSGVVPGRAAPAQSGGDGGWAS